MRQLYRVKLKQTQNSQKLKRRNQSRQRVSKNRKAKRKDMFKCKIMKVMSKTLKVKGKDLLLFNLQGSESCLKI